MSCVSHVPNKVRDVHENLHLTELLIWQLYSGLCAKYRRESTIDVGTFSIWDCQNTWHSSDIISGWREQATRIVATFPPFWCVETSDSKYLELNKKISPVWWEQHPVFSVRIRCSWTFKPASALWNFLVRINGDYKWSTNLVFARNMTSCRGVIKGGSVYITRIKYWWNAWYN